MINFKCSCCSNDISFADQYSGMASKCPMCDEVVKVPEPMGTILKPIEEKQIVNIKGNWCPNCKNRNSRKKINKLAAAVVITPLALLPLIPDTWVCLTCGNEW